MKNYQYLLYMSLLAISACNVHTRSVHQQPDSTTTKEIAENKAMFAIMQIADTIKTGEQVLLKFTVYNNADSIRRFCKWHTPFEPLLSKYLEIRGQDGEEVNYQGPMAKRMMPPPEDSYLRVNAGDSISAIVDILKAYPIEKPSKYTIIYTGQNMSGLQVKDSVSFVYIKK